MTKLLAAIIPLLIAFSASAQNAILSVMLEKSDMVAHVKVIDAQGGRYDEIGVQEWYATCEVIEPIKGTLKASDKVRFHFNTFEFLNNTEPPIVANEKEYVVFLTVSSNSELPIHEFNLLDRWTGALPYHIHLANRLKEYMNGNSSQQPLSPP